MHEPEKIGSVIGKVNTFSKKKKGSEIEKIKKYWIQIVGETAGVNSKPTKISRGTLYVVTRDDPWSSEISMRSGQLLAKLKASTGIAGIGKVRIKSDRRAFSTINESLNSKEYGKNSKESSGEENDLGWEGKLPQDEKVREALMRFIRSSK